MDRLSTPPPLVAALVKRVDLRPSVDPLTGELHHDPHGGLSAADECALELALRTAEATGTTVLAATAGGPECDAVLHQALAAGATEAVRVDLPAATPSAEVAAALSDVVAGCRWIWCGDFSLDRGSGSVPAFVAAELGASQALGAAAVDLDGLRPKDDPEIDGREDAGASGAAGLAGAPEAAGLADASHGLRVERRIDGGRREVLLVAAPAVVSVESGIAPLRRSSLRGVLGARRAGIRVVAGASSTGHAEPRTRPYRPRARILSGPDPHLPPRERMVILSGALAQREPPRVVRVGAEEAVDELLAFLAARGYQRPGEPADP